MNRIRSVLVAVALLQFLASPGLAQSTVEQFRKEFTAATQEIDEFREILNGDDFAMAEQAMKFMLQSNKPALVNAGKEFGLYSSSAALQKAALTEVLNSSKRLRATLSKTGQDSKPVFDYLIKNGAIERNDTINFLVGVEGFSQEQECWKLNGRSSSGCGLLITGDILMLDYDGLRAEMELSDAGTLVGPVVYFFNAPKGQAHLTIDLFDN